MRHLARFFPDLLSQAVAFSIVALTIVTLYDNNLSLLAALTAEALAALWLWHERRDVAMFTVVATVGSAAEALFVHHGVWVYANPTALGVPIWFPVSFGLASLIGQRLARTVTAIWEGARPTRTL